MKQATIKKLFHSFIEQGIENDPRGIQEVHDYLLKNSQSYEKLSKKEKQYYDEEFLSNPYHDSTIYYGDHDMKVKKAIVWIDVEWPEILLVHEYNKIHKKSPIDLIIGHHPVGKGLQWIAPLQKWVAPFVAHRTGVPISAAEKIEHTRVCQVEQRFSPMNHARAIPFAKMLDIPYMWVHTPADNCCHMFLEKYISDNEKKLKTLQDIIDILLEIPEMSRAAKNAGWPKIWNGTPESRCWKISVTGITGGTESSKDIYAEYAKAGISTILEMHMSPDHLEEAKKANLNVIMTDHMASDSLGMNLLMDIAESQWVEILDFSWFTRISRVKK